MVNIPLFFQYNIVKRIKYFICGHNFRFKANHQTKVQISFTHAGIVTFIIKMYHHDNLDQPSKYSLFEKSLKYKIKLTI